MRHSLDRYLLCLEGCLLLVVLHASLELLRQATHELFVILLAHFVKSDLPELRSFEHLTFFDLAFQVILLVLQVLKLQRVHVQRTFRALDQRFLPLTRAIQLSIVRLQTKQDSGSRSSQIRYLPLIPNGIPVCQQTLRLGGEA